MTPTVDIAPHEKPYWTDTERANAELVADFIRTLMNEHDFDAVLERFGGGSYRQHNRSMRDGVPGVIENVKGLVKRFPEFSYDVRGIVASGDLVVVHSHSTLRAKDRGNEKRGFVIFDQWRVVDGTLVEHWDAIQPLDLTARMFVLFSGGRIRNDNGLF